MSSRLDWATDREDFPRQADYRLGALAESASITPQRLRLYFIQRFGISTKSWLLELSKRDAFSLRVRGKLIKEVAGELGYKQVSSLCRRFKQDATSQVRCSTEPFGGSRMLRSERQLGL